MGSPPFQSGSRLYTPNLSGRAHRRTRAKVKNRAGRGLWNYTTFCVPRFSHTPHNWYLWPRQLSNQDIFSLTYLDCPFSIDLQLKIIFSRTLDFTRSYELLRGNFIKEKVSYRSMKNKIIKSKGKFGIASHLQIWPSSEVNIPRRTFMLQGSVWLSVLK